jgi:hypothetical protein
VVFTFLSTFELLVVLPVLTLEELLVAEELFLPEPNLFPLTLPVLPVLVVELPSLEVPVLTLEEPVDLTSLPVFLKVDKPERVFLVDVREVFPRLFLFEYEFLLPLA